MATPKLARLRSQIDHPEYVRPEFERMTAKRISGMDDPKIEKMLLEHRAFLMPVMKKSKREVIKVTQLAVEEPYRHARIPKAEYFMVGHNEPFQRIRSTYAKSGSSKGYRLGNTRRMYGNSTDIYNYN